MKRHLAAILVALFFLSVAFAAAPTIPPSAPYVPPSALSDVGSPSSCPFIVLASGQSNMVGEDHNGAHLVGANTLTTNSFLSPTALVSAAYGSAPFNVGYGGGVGAPQITTSTASLTNINQAMAFGYYLRQSGMLPASRPIVLMLAAAASQSISDWVSPSVSFTASQSTTTLTVTAVASGAINNAMYITVPGGTNEYITAQLTSTAPNGVLGGAGTYTVSVSQTISGESMTAATSVNMSTLVSAHWSVVSSAYPGCPINLVLWDQGENDNSGTYGTNAAYGAAFTGATYQGTAFQGTTGLVPLIQALSGWSNQTRWVNVELGTWATNTQQVQNGFLQATKFGALYPWMSFISTAGLAPSPDYPLPHYSGAAEEAIGQREYAAWANTRIYGAWQSPLNYNGAAQSFPNTLTANNNGAITATIGASFTATASSGTLTVTGDTGLISVGDKIATGPLAGAIVTAYGSGTGGNGTYTINSATTVGSGTAMTTSSYVLNVTAEATGTMSTGLWIAGTSVTNGSIINALGTGTGGTGTYLMSASSAYVSSESMTAYPSFSVDDVRSGAMIYASTAFLLPNAGQVAQGTVVDIDVNSAFSTINLYAMSPQNFANIGTISSYSNSTLRGGYKYQAVVTQDGRWTIFSMDPGQGNTRFFEGTSAYSGGSITFTSSYLNHAYITLTNETVTITPAPGNEWVFGNVTTASTVTLSVGSFILPNGQTATSITMQPGEVADFAMGIGPSNTLYTYILFDNVLSGQSTLGTKPTNSGTCAIGTQFGGNVTGSFIGSGACAAVAGGLVLSLSITAPNGWACFVNDLTTPADAIKQTAYTTTTATFLTTWAASDLVEFHCNQF